LKIRPHLKDTSESTSEDSLSSTPAGMLILSFLCGMVVAFMGFKSIRQDFLAINKLTHLENLKTTPAKILQLKIRQDSTGSKNDCYPDVLYEFFIEGKSIWGWRFSFEEEPRPRVYWEERLRDYQVGQNVSAYYNPAFPKDAILEKKHSNVLRIWMKMIVGIGFVFVGATLVFIPVWSWTKKFFVTKK